MKHSILVHEPDSPTELDFYGQVLRTKFPGVDVKLASNPAQAADLAGDCDIMIAKSMHIDQRIVDAMPRFAWFQSLISGVDFLRTLKLPTDLMVSAARGIHGTQMSELAILHMLALNRRLPEMLRNQVEHQWAVWTQPLLEDKRLVIVGVGAIAETVAKRCLNLGMRVSGVSSRTSAPGFERLYPRSKITEAVAAADFVLALVPLSEQTRGLIGSAVFNAMRRDAFLVNIARGGIVDEPALIEALSSGRIAGAAIDVASVEPLPADNPLWDAPNLIITPHVGGRSNVYHQQVSPLLSRNVGLYLSGDRAQIPYQVEL